MYTFVCVVGEGAEYCLRKTFCVFTQVCTWNITKIQLSSINLKIMVKHKGIKSAVLWLCDQ